MRVLVVGGSGGIGSAFVALLCERPDVEHVVATYRTVLPAIEHAKLQWQQVDPCNESEIARLCESHGPWQWVINAVGLLHSAERGPEKTIKRFDGDFFLENMRVNTLPTLLLAKHLDKPFKGVKGAVFATVSAKVGSISDNQLGGWVSYRSSKAALNMALKTVAIEWRLRHPQLCVAALHPGTTDTALSKPFQSNVPEGKLFTPQYSAQCMLNVIERLSADDTGRFWSWDGSELPW